MAVTDCPLCIEKALLALFCSTFLFSSILSIHQLISPSLSLFLGVYLHNYRLLSLTRTILSEPVLPLSLPPQSTLERCSKCSKPILDRILRAMGKAYHPRCFNCVVCGCCLDGVPFTVDATYQIHCIDDFHRLETRRKLRFEFKF